MARKRNIYHKIVKNEDSLTELLANLLCFSNFKKAFAQFVASRIGFLDFSFQYADVSTQKNFGELGRPDLVIENETFCLVFECKTIENRQLTDNQPTGYLQHLQAITEKKCALIFLVPYFYQSESLIKKRRDDFVQANEPSKAEFAITYWHELAAVLQLEKAETDNIAIAHFIELLQTEFPHKHIEFSKEAWAMAQNKATPTLILNIIDLVGQIQRKVPNDFKTELEINAYGIGCYLKNKQNEYLLWFGCSYEFWRDYGSLLHLGVGQDEYGDFSEPVIEKFKEKLVNGVVWYKAQAWYKYPIPETLLQDQPNLSAVVNLVVEVAQHCNPDQSIQL